MKNSTERAAVISAVGVIVAAVIGGIFVYLSRPADKVVNNTNDHSLYSTPQPVTPQSTEANSSTVNKSNTIPHEMYEAVAEVGESKTYIDKETGFVFAVDQISTGLFGERSGALSRYTLPDGTIKRPYRLKPGYRVDFQYQGRKFFMVIEDVDYGRKVAKIRIKEIPT
jgi:hypothetical protein